MRTDPNLSHLAPSVVYTPDNPPPDSLSSQFASKHLAASDLQAERSFLANPPSCYGIPYTPGLTCPQCGGKALRSTCTVRTAPDLYSYDVTTVTCHDRLRGKSRCEVVVESKVPSERNVI